eukprot:TRINITY_DN11859_c0_g1_i4.p1 TRINITY_DN11859_c0_g1~~TRINITY_DN11859_c0_g1_i4.p1  ORF type:complete len:229 (+),score=59.33 TRINITY_DN11859_c0_g1_i4:179-865(+)
MNEELRNQREAIADLEEEKNQLLAYKEQTEELRNDYFGLRSENSELSKELDRAHEEIESMKCTRKAEMEKLKNSFDEMDELLEKEKEAHKAEEQKLLAVISGLEVKCKSASEEIVKRNSKLEEYLDKLGKCKENEKGFQEAIKNNKRREIELKNQLSKVKGSISELQAKNKELVNMIEKISADNDALKLQTETEKKKVTLHTHRVECNHGKEKQRIRFTPRQNAICQL